MLTLAQLYDLGMDVNIDIYAGIQLPADSPMDRNTLVNTIIMRCGMNIPMYAEPYVMASAISLWSAKNQYTFEHIGKIYEAAYSPIENYDRFEDGTTDRKRDMTDNTTGSNTKNEQANIENAGKTVEDRKTNTTSNDNITNENTTSAYNSATYQPDSKSTTSDNRVEGVTEKGNITNNTTGNSTKNTTGSNKNDKAVKENELTTNKTHMHGNIGISTAMSMEREEYELMKDCNPYDFIAGLFEDQLTLFVY